MQLVGSEGYTLCRLVLQIEDVSDFVYEYVHGSCIFISRYVLKYGGKRSYESL